MTGRQLASKLGLPLSALDRILQGRSGISPEMALRLSKALGRSPESWLAMQDTHELWPARQWVNLEAVEKVEFRVALGIDDHPRISEARGLIDGDPSEPYLSLAVFDDAEGSEIETGCASSAAKLASTRIEIYLTSITLSGRRQLEWPVGDGFSLGWGFRFYFSFFRAA